MTHRLKLGLALLCAASVGLVACNDDRPGRNRPPHERGRDGGRDHDRNDRHDNRGDRGRDGPNRPR